MGIVTGNNNSFKGRLWASVSSYIGAMIIGDLIMVCLSYIVDTTWGLIVISGINWMMLLVVIYSTMWEQGNIDLNKTKFHGNGISYKKAFLISLLTNSLSLFMGILLIFAHFEILVNPIFIYKILNPHVWPIMNLMNNTLFPASMELWQVILCVVISQLPILFGTVFYILGSKNIDIIRKTMYQKKN